MSKNLKTFRESLGLTQRQFARELGIGVTTYNGYETGARDPKSDFWILLARRYGVTIDYLMGCSGDPHKTSLQGGPSMASAYSPGEREHIKKYRVLDVHGKETVDSVLELEYKRMTRHDEDKVEHRDNVSYLRYFDFAVSAGTGEPLGDSGGSQRMSFPTERVPEDAHYCVRVNGDSMEPAYRDGDIVFVQRLDECVRVGEIGIFVLNGEGYIKRWGQNELISLNPAYPPIPIGPFDRLDCQGRVLGKV